MRKNQSVSGKYTRKWFPAIKVVGQQAAKIEMKGALGLPEK